MSHEVGVEVSVGTGIELVEFGVKLNYQFTYSSSSSYTEFSEQTVTDEINVPKKNATALFSKHIWMKGVSFDESEVISEIQFVANDELHFSGYNL